MEQQQHRAYERKKSKQKQNQVTSLSISSRALLLDLAPKQCIGIIKQWLHSLMSDSKGKFLVNDMLMFGLAWCLVIAAFHTRETGNY